MIIESINKYVRKEIDKAFASISTDRLARDPKAQYKVVKDNGIKGIADQDDVFLNKGRRLRISGHSPVIQDMIKSRLTPWQFKLWKILGALNAPARKPLPIFEGISSAPTKNIKFAGSTDEKNVQDVLVREFATVANIFGIKIKRTNFTREPYVQDAYIPFDDHKTKGISLGVFKHSATVAHFNSSRPVKIRRMANVHEGGNVVIAKNAQGRTKAIIGYKIVRYTRLFLRASHKEAIRIIAADFNLKPEDIIVVPQANYHVDLHIRAGKPGEVFVASRSAGIKMLEECFKKSDFGDEMEGMAELVRRVYVSISSRRGQLQLMQLEQTARILGVHGFKVIDYPSIFFRKEEFPQSYISINMMNNRYVTTKSGIVVNIMLGSGYRLINDYIKAKETRHFGSDIALFIADDAAGPSYFGHIAISKWSAGFGCYTNF